MAVDDTLLIFTPLHNEPPDADYAWADRRNAHSVLNFPSAAIHYAQFTSIMPHQYNVGNNLQVILHYTSLATAGTVEFYAAFERIGDEFQDIDADGFAAARGFPPDIVPAVNGRVGVITVDFTNIQADGVLPGETFRLQIYRDGLSDASTKIAQLVALEIREI